MKLVVLIYDEAIDDAVMAMLHETAKKCNCQCRYSKIRGVEGAGATGERDGTWKHPGINHMLFCLAQEEQVAALGQAVDVMEKRLVSEQGDLPYLGVNVIVLPAEAALLGGERFGNLLSSTE